VIRVASGNVVAMENWKTKGMDDASMAVAEAQVLIHSVDFVHDCCFKSIKFEMN